MRRWSKLQKKLYDLMDPRAGFQIHMALYEMNSNDGYHSEKLPRYFITCGKEIIFDYPKDFDTGTEEYHTTYPWMTDISAISNLIEAYINTPVNDLMDTFPDDRWGLTDLLRAADRRIGKRRADSMLENTENRGVRLLLMKRYGNPVA